MIELAQFAAAPKRCSNAFLWISWKFVASGFLLPCLNALADQPRGLNTPQRRPLDLPWSGGILF
jgi:hypothetical protein